MQLLKIRYLQARRDLGLWVVLIAVAIGLLAYGFTEPGSKNNSVLTAALVLLFFLYHQNRRDLNFIETYFGNSPLHVSLGYSLSALPVSIALLLHSLWPYALVLHLALMGVAFYKPATVRIPKLLFLTRLIPPQQFEWKSGLRQNFVVLLPLLVVALALSPVKLFALVAVFIINLVIAGFYTQHEPLALLNPQNMAIRVFLRKKATFNAGLLSAFNLLVLTINSAFQPEMLWFNFFYFFALVLLAVFAVYVKYATYQPNESLAFSADMLVISTAVLLPYLLPLGIYVFVNARRKAYHNLNHYLA